MGKNETTREQVQQFLDTLKNWLTFFGGQVLYDTRQKNLDFMTEMEWTSPDRKKEWLLKIEPEDYYEGPTPNEDPGMDNVWVFGKRIQGRLCYIKIHLMKKPNVYCISFHFAEHDMYLLFKDFTEEI